MTRENNSIHISQDCNEDDVTPTGQLATYWLNNDTERASCVGLHNLLNSTGKYTFSAKFEPINLILTHLDLSHNSIRTMTQFTLRPLLALKVNGLQNNTI